MRFRPVSRTRPFIVFPLKKVLQKRPACPGISTRLARRVASVEGSGAKMMPWGRIQYNLHLPARIHCLVDFSARKRIICVANRTNFGGGAKKKASLRFFARIPLVGYVAKNCEEARFRLGSSREFACLCPFPNLAPFWFFAKKIRVKAPYLPGDRDATCASKHRSRGVARQKYLELVCNTIAVYPDWTSCVQTDEKAPCNVTFRSFALSSSPPPQLDSLERSHVLFLIKIDYSVLRRKRSCFGNFFSVLEPNLRRHFAGDAWGPLRPDLL